MSDRCDECGDPPGFTCVFCGFKFCDAHIDDHGAGCEELYAADIESDREDREDRW